MDWSKAKNILIFILLILNIFLLVNISLANPGGSLDKAVIETAKINLQAKGVIIKCDIPRKKVASVTLNTESVKLDRSKIASTLSGALAVSPDKLIDGEEFTEGGKKIIFKNGSNFLYKDNAPGENLNTSDAKAIEAFSRKFFDKLELPVSAYYLDSSIKNPDGSIDLVFLEKFKSFPVLDSYVKLTLTSKGITYMDCKVRKVKGLVNSENNFMYAHQILLTNYIVGNGTVITDIDLGFGQEDSKELSESLVWQIKTENGARRYFLASTGKEISLM